MEPQDQQAPQQTAEQPPQQTQPAPAPQQDQTAPAPQPTDQKANKGYGKRPVWQWVLIYLIIAVIVYGLVYLIFFHKSGSSGGGSSLY